MIELCDATEVVNAVRDGDAYVYWAPGDSTLYRVTLVRAHSSSLDALSEADDLVALLVMLGRRDVRDNVVLERPHHGGRGWSPEMFANRVHDNRLGWWPAVRPLLAALGWTEPEYSEVTYRAEDAVDLQQLLDPREGIKI